MDFLRHKLGFLTVLAVVALLAAVAWFCLAGAGRETMPEGTLVQRQAAEAVL